MPRKSEKGDDSGQESSLSFKDKQELRRSEKAAKQKGKQRCFICNQTGHTKKECPGVEDGGRGQSRFKSKHANGAKNSHKHRGKLEASADGQTVAPQDESLPWIDSFCDLLACAPPDGVSWLSGLSTSSTTSQPRHHCVGLVVPLSNPVLFESSLDFKSGAVVDEDGGAVVPALVYTAGIPPQLASVYDEKVHSKLRSLMLPASPTAAVAAEGGSSEGTGGEQMTARRVRCWGPIGLDYSAAAVTSEKTARGKSVAPSSRVSDPGNTEKELGTKMWAMAGSEGSAEEETGNEEVAEAEEGGAEAAAVPEVAAAVVPSKLREEQMEAFVKQLREAVSMGVPAVLTLRPEKRKDPEGYAVAEKDFVAALLEAVPEQHQSHPMLLHAFAGRPELVGKLCTVFPGLRLGFSGLVTHAKNDALREALFECPLPRLLLESDTPHAAPPATTTTAAPTATTGTGTTTPCGSGGGGVRRPREDSSGSGSISRDGYYCGSVPAHVLAVAEVAAASKRTLDARSVLQVSN
eukprot:CAMPEP_0171786814 /NCGR_PEP_ID=MMETSP0991-20121206/63540_1 /TAXON_ID=483369 /ORGANISM="non described non described, Strain CCMP2098" /LENGTH=519 /DNA_ID=CAMNT_0012395669 /DNA_START=158 /DNA_END=1714 /DNA_ORIENTATION=+